MPLTRVPASNLLCRLVTMSLLIAGVSVAKSAYAVEDFRHAIKSIVPHLVLVRRIDEQPKAAVDATKKATVDERLIEALRSRDRSSNFQHAFRVAEDLVATVDLGSPAAEHQWELLSRDRKWHTIEVVGRDNISKLILLRVPPDLLNSTVRVVSSEPATAPQKWSRGVMEMGLPSVVVWYEDGGPRAKSAMIAATGNANTRGLSVLDFAFNRTHVGSPVLDAEGNLLGLVASRREADDGRDLVRRLEIPQLEQQTEADPSADDSPVPAPTLSTLPPRTIVISADSFSGDDRTAEYVVPVELLDRLVTDVSNSDQPVVLDYGLIGIRLGNGDGTIRSIIRGGAAEEADCKRGDKIVAVDGVNVQTDGDIMNAIMFQRAGDTITLDLSASTASEGADPTVALTRTIEIKMRGIRPRDSVPETPN